MEEGHVNSHGGPEPKMQHVVAPSASHPMRHRTKYVILHDDHQPFIGRLGGNQRFVLNPDDPKNAHALHDTPDAAPFMTLKQQFALTPFRSIGLWKRAFTEGVGTMLFTYLSAYPALSPYAIPNPPDAQLGVFDNAAFIGPLISSIMIFLGLTLFIITFGAVTGAHLNPTITFATFCVRLCSLPRFVLYVLFQTAGGALGGLLLRASWGGTDFKSGGCWMFTDIVPVGEAFVIEMFATMILLFLALGVGLDPRQRAVIPPSLSPFLVGLSTATVALSTAYTRYGYGGASLNPARCFGVFVGSNFQSYHWIHWVGDIAACIIHGCVYLLVPPGKLTMEDTSGG